ncbi:hypothetical protein T492DRAFT_912369 [Pavlovales sp. CCMP2436]|nr:hypothetical protein T492DRAFT_912369 [Pavlovales sp. CCMP2436]
MPATGYLTCKCSTTTLARHMKGEGCVQHRGVQSRAQGAGDPFRNFQIADDIEDANLHAMRISTSRSVPIRCSGEQGAMPEWGLDVHGDALPWTERLVV